MSNGYHGKRGSKSTGRTAPGRGKVLTITAKIAKTFDRGAESILNRPKRLAGAILKSPAKKRTGKKGAKKK